MADAFDNPTPAVTADAFDDPTSGDPHPYETWINNLIPRVAEGVARGAGIPTSMDQLKQLGSAGADPMNILKNIAGPIPPAIYGMGANMVDASKRMLGGDMIGGGAQAAATIAPLFGLGDELRGNAPPELAESAPVNPSIKKLTETLPVPEKQVPRFQQAAATAVPALKEFETPGNPITLKNWHTAQELAEAKRNNAAASFLSPAIAHGVTVDGNIIADEMQKAIPDAWKTDPKYGQVYQAAMKEANDYRKPIPIQDNINGIQYNNARLTPFYRANEDQQYAMQAGGFPLNELEAEARGRRQALAKAVDPEHGGQQFQQIRQEQSDLINFRQQGEALENKLQKQYTPTGAQQAGQAVSDIGSIWHGDYRQALASKMKQAPQLGDMFSDAFKNYKGPDNPETPTRPFQLVPPSGKLTVNIQREMFPKGTPSFQEGSEVGPQTFHLEQQGPQQSFIRQRNWNEVLADPKTLANESTEVGHHRMDLQQQGPRQDFLRQLGLDEQ